MKFDLSNLNIFIVNTAHTSSGSQPLTTNANSAKYDLIVDAASATTSATAAATSATAAASSATAAASSATTASTQASNASTLVVGRGGGRGLPYAGRASRKAPHIMSFVPRPGCRCSGFNSTQDHLIP